IPDGHAGRVPSRMEDSMRTLILAAAAAVAFASAACAQGTNIQFVTVGAPGNPGYPNPSPPGYFSVQGRGEADYEYRIGKYEVTTAQWMEFVNTYSTLGGQWTFFGLPTHWGARTDPNYFGPGRRYIFKNLAQADMMPVYGISWRTAAMFCNWLHND